jgi:hypothetical protein
MIDAEPKRRQTTLEMITSENFAPCAVTAAQSCPASGFLARLPHHSLLVQLHFAVVFGFAGAVGAPLLVHPP